MVLGFTVSIIKTLWDLYKYIWKHYNSFLDNYIQKLELNRQDISQQAHLLSLCDRWNHLHIIDAPQVQNIYHHNPEMTCPTKTFEARIHGSSKETHGRLWSKWIILWYFIKGYEIISLSLPKQNCKCLPLLPPATQQQRYPNQNQVSQKGTWGH